MKVNPTNAMNGHKCTLIHLEDCMMRPLVVKGGAYEYY